MGANGFGVRVYDMAGRSPSGTSTGAPNHRPEGWCILGDRVNFPKRSFELSGILHVGPTNSLLLVPGT